MFTPDESAAFRVECHELADRLAAIRDIDATWASVQSADGAQPTKVLACHDVAVVRHLNLIFDVLRGEAKRLLVQKQRRNGMRGEGSVQELIPYSFQVRPVGEHPRPFGWRQGWYEIAGHCLLSRVLIVSQPRVLFAVGSRSARNDSWAASKLDREIASPLRGSQ